MDKPNRLASVVNATGQSDGDLFNVSIAVSFLSVGMKNKGMLVYIVVVSLDAAAAGTENIDCQSNRNETPRSRYL